ncbi:MAG TPA: hypothetical protein VGP47_08430 [Parachlamydiaceae bacterium]|nr:hypothetical protein [Parachlamydiaceae bacterium]
MKSDSQLEAQIQKNELALQELAIRAEALDRDVDGLLSQLNVSPEQLTTFIENKDNFSEENWNSLQELRKALDEKLLRELLNVSNPKKTRDSFKKMNPQPHWLFVR